MSHDLKPFEKIDKIGDFMVAAFNRLALFAIGCATVWAFIFAYHDSVAGGNISIQDLLLLFIFLEIGAMVGVYFQTNHMPTRFLIYIGITALTRHLVDMAAVAPVDSIDHFLMLIAIGFTILIMSGAVYVIRKGSYKYPTIKDETH